MFIGSNLKPFIFIMSIMFLKCLLKLNLILDNYMLNIRLLLAKIDFLFNLNLSWRFQMDETAVDN